IGGVGDVDSACHPTGVTSVGSTHDSQVFNACPTNCRMCHSGNLTLVRCSCFEIPMQRRTESQGSRCSVDRLDFDPLAGGSLIQPLKPGAILLLNSRIVDQIDEGQIPGGKIICRVHCIDP